MSFLSSVSTLEKLVIPSETADLGYSQFNLFLIGCGGTGSFVVQHLARLMASGDLAAERIAGLTLVDFDIVEPKNVARQLFTPADVGRPKAEVLARRYASAYGIRIGYLVAPFEEDMLGENIPGGSLRTPTLLVGAVDQAGVRKEILKGVQKLSGARQAVYWFDAGNGEITGQVAWGNTGKLDLVKKGIGQPIVEYLPYPALVFPEIADPARDTGQGLSIPLPESCAEAIQDGRQGPNINAMMGLLTIEMVRQFLTGKLSAHYVAVDLTSFTLGSQPITDEWLEDCSHQK
jgi:PRTRC genetic system ThiF family protein